MTNTVKTTAMLAVAGCALAASAQPTFLVFVGETLYRFGEAGPIDSFSMGHQIMGLGADENGVIRGTEGQTPNRASWRLDDPEGTPTLTQLSTNIPGPRASISYVNGTPYTITNIDHLVQLDPSNLEDVADLGAMGTPQGFGGSGYDGQTLYASNGSDDMLYSIDIGSVSATPIGSFGVDFRNSGMEYFNGTMYAVVEDPNALEYWVGSVDLGTGAFTPIRMVTGYDGTEMLSSIVVIPAPAGLAVLGLGALAARRRR
ncbi:MAG: hypothetical protein KDA28_04620 [Phycisphaerales bacterium]|nr:hypothetical protein [Phycisphaerales bacterium]